MKSRLNLMLYGIFKYSAGAVLIGLMIFLPAGTLQYAGGWRFLILLFAPMLVLGIVLLLKAPELLAKRLQHGESQDDQKKVIGLNALQFIPVATGNPNLSISILNISYHPLHFEKSKIIGFSGISLYASSSCVYFFLSIIIISPSKGV